MEIKKAVEIFSTPYRKGRGISLSDWFEARAIVLANPKEAKAICKIETAKSKDPE